LEAFFTSMLLVAVAEIGDKTEWQACSTWARCCNLDLQKQWT